jgi:hypothetical protein
MDAWVFHITNSETFLVTAEAVWRPEKIKPIFEKYLSSSEATNITLALCKAEP